MRTRHCLIGGAAALLLVGSASAQETTDEETYYYELEVGTATDSSALVNQSLINNVLEESNVFRKTLIENSYINNRGIISVNQAAGDLNNQGLVRAVTAAAAQDSTLLMFQGDASQVRSGNVVTTSGPREDRISTSFGHTVGIVGVNQSAGSLNQQSSILSVSFGTTPGPTIMAMGDSTLGGVHGEPDQVTRTSDDPRTDVIDGPSFAGYIGVSQIQQAAGSNNDVSSFVGISVSVLNPP